MSARILVVDDDPDVLALTRMTLERAGFAVAVASGGLQAIEWLGSETPDLVVLDVMMPQISGWEVLDFLKNNEATAAVPVLMMTARDKPDDVKVGYDYGARYYLTKPWRKEELLHGISVALGRPDLMPGGAPERGPGRS
jgi:DNA-binding response OmpR family regulator